MEIRLILILFYILQIIADGIPCKRAFRLLSFQRELHSRSFCIDDVFVCATYGLLAFRKSNMN